MKFSIKFLLALLVLAALLANYFVANQSQSRLIGERNALKDETEGLIFAEQEAKASSAIYAIGLNGEEHLHTKYQAAFDQNKDLPIIVSQLDIEDPNGISYRNLPLLDEGNLKHLAFRIHIPPNKTCHLVTEFENGRFAFEAPERNATLLPPGEHVIDYRYDYDDKQLLELFLDDQKIFSIKTRGNQNGFSTQTGAKFQTDIPVLTKPKRLLQLKPSMEPNLPRTDQPKMTVLLQGASDE